MYKHTHACMPVACLYSMVRQCGAALDHVMSVQGCCHRWTYWGAYKDGRWWCSHCHCHALHYHRCKHCLQWRCDTCVRLRRKPTRYREALLSVAERPSCSVLDVRNHSVAWDANAASWVSDAHKLFSNNGFVIIHNVLEPNERHTVLQDCEHAAEQIVGFERRGNRGPGRYSFGSGSSTGSMLHVQSFSTYLLNNGCLKLQPALNMIFDGCFICTGGGGDFVVGGTKTDQELHSDMIIKSKDDVWLPPPMISVNFVIQALTSLNGPLRIIPGTQLWRGEVPDPIAEDWLHSCLCPVPAGSAIIRDVRVLHSGTRNLTDQIRFLPSIEFVSTGFRETERRDCFPPNRTLPNDMHERLHPDIMKLCSEIVIPKGREVYQSYIMK